MYSVSHCKMPYKMVMLIASTCKYSMYMQFSTQECMYERKYTLSSKLLHKVWTLDYIPCISVKNHLGNENSIYLVKRLCFKDLFRSVHAVTVSFYLADLEVFFQVHKYTWHSINSTVYNWTIFVFSSAFINLFVANYLLHLKCTGTA